MTTTDYYNDFRQEIRSSLVTDNSEWGSFDPLVLSISLADRIEMGVALDAARTNEHLFGFGTYLHENMHWYQCVGTTYGVGRLLTSMAQSFGTFNRMRRAKLAKADIAKPLYRLLAETEPHKGASRQLFNQAVNNWMDIEFTNAYFEQPSKYFERIRQDRFFRSLRHGSLVYIYEFIKLLADCCTSAGQYHEDSGQIILAELESSEHANQVVPPIGAAEIMEAAARISEIQYLQRASGRIYTWDKYKRMGLLEQKYIHAFNFFLKATLLDVGDDPCSSVTSLFLLVCDAALNPTVGYPRVIENPREFYRNWHPGVRFSVICSILRMLQKRISFRSLSVDRDFADLCRDLCSVAGFDDPLKVAEECVCLARSIGAEENLARLDSYSSNWPNLPAGYIIAKHLVAMKVRLQQPFFLSIPAQYTKGDFEHQQAIHDTMESLAPPFLRRNRGALQPIIPRESSISARTTEEFFSTLMKWLVLFNMGRQLVSRNGSFVYTLPWIDSARSTADVRKFVDDDFERLSGYCADEIKLWQGKPNSC